MGRYIDLKGVKQGKLTVLEYIGYDSKKGRTMWMCECECGLKLPVSTHDLRGKRAHKSCRQCSKAAIKHNLSNTAEYAVWKNMVRRCTNEKDVSFFRYGGRGISVCERWLYSFENFYEDMGQRPYKTYTLERIDNDGNYCPENCKWATRKDQARNYRHNRILEFKGEKHCISEWAEILGVNHDYIWKKLNKGKSVEDVLGNAKFRMPNLIEYKGESFTLSKLEAHLGFGIGTLRHRIKNGKTLQESINMGIGHGGYKQINKRKIKNNA